MIPRFPALGLALMLVLTGCGDRNAFHDLYDPAALGIRSDRYLVFEGAPVVLAGVVTRVNAVGGPQPARRQQELLLQLTKVDVHVENVLRSEIAAPEISFYFFAYSSENRGYSGPPRYQVSAGDRRIFFLTKEQGRLRSFGDVLDYTLFVASGSHKYIRTGTDQPFGLAISELLLAPGDGLYVSSMCGNLALSCEVSDHLGSRANTVRLLKALLRGADKSLAAAACVYLAENYNGQYACLSEALSFPGIDAKVRSRVEELMRVNRQHEGELKVQLTRFPLQAMASIPFPDSLYAVRQELQLLLDDPDPQTRKLACDALRRNYPEPETRCDERLKTSIP